MTVAETKRFLELWIGNKKFKNAYSIDSDHTLKEYGLHFKSEDVDPLIDLKKAKELGTKVSQRIKEYRKFIKEKKEHRDSVREKGSAENIKIRTWRKRQIERCYFELGKERYHSIVHAPVSFELCKGCTVGCWFCGVSALPFEGYFPYTEQTSKLWKEILFVMKEFLGKESAQQAFCYWATDPLDNPDYEKFIWDFHDFFGEVPQTTTALAMRDPERTKKLLKELDKRNGWVQRFSVLNPKTLDEIHRYFTPDELTDVELILQFDNKTHPKSVAGRVKEVVDKKEKEGKTIHSFKNPGFEGTIACVSGFLFNMVEKTVKLISPCNASSKWPLGYVIFGEKTFVTGEDLKQGINELIDTHMNQQFKLDQIVSFYSVFKLNLLEKGFTLTTPFYKTTFNSFYKGRELAELIEEKKHTAFEIAERREKQFGIDPFHTFQDINKLFRKGVFAEEDIKS